MIIAMVLNIALSISPTPASAREIDAAHLAALATPLAEDRVFYRWQSTASGENLARLGVMNEAADRRFMAMDRGVVAGPGIYMAESAHSSESYMPRAGGNLLEVKIKAGTPVIDVTDPVTVQRMAAAGVHHDDLFRQPNYPEGVLIKYEGDYLVGKNLAGRASFNLFPGPQHGADDVLHMLGPIVAEAPKNQAAAQVLAHRPDLARQIARRLPFDEIALRMVPPADLADHLVRHAGAIGGVGEVSGVYALLRARPEVAAAVLAKPRAAAQIIPKLMAGPLANDESLARAPRVIKDALVRSTTLPSEDRRRVAHELARTILREPSSTADLPARVPELTELLGRGPLDARTRNIVASVANRALGEFDAAEDDLAPVRDLLRAGGLESSPQHDRVEAIERRRRAFARALATRAPDDVARALADQRDFAQFQNTVAELRRTVPPAVLDRAAQRYFADRPPDFGAMLKDHRDWHVATTAATSRGRGLDLLPHVYDAAVDGAASARAWFFEPCLDDERCAKYMLGRLRADPRPFFRGVGDLNVFAALLHESKSPLAADLVRATLPGLNADQLHSFARVLEDRPAFAAPFRARAEALVKEGVTTRQALHLARDFESGTAGRARMLAAAIATAGSPAEATVVAFAIQGEGDERALGRKLTERLASLGPTEDELARFNRTPLASGPARVPTVREPDCLGRLSRALDL